MFLDTVIKLSQSALKPSYLIDDTFRPEYVNTPIPFFPTNAKLVELMEETLQAHSISTTPTCLKSNAE